MTSAEWLQLPSPEERTLIRNAFARLPEPPAP